MSPLYKKIEDRKLHSNNEMVMYEQRKYRQWVKDEGLVNFQVVSNESDLFIRADKDLRIEAEDLVKKYRRQIENYIRQDPEFLTSLDPCEVDPSAPPIIREMANAAKRAGVGPMAAVAGAIAEYVGKELLTLSAEVIIENGGDVYIKSQKKRNLGVYAGNSPYTGGLAIEVESQDTPLVVATSSGTVGHSLSFGSADAAVVISKSGALSDASATRLGNLVNRKEDIDKALGAIKEISGISGALVVVAPAGTGLTTTEPEPILAPLPTSIAPNMTTSLPITTLSLIVG